MFAVGIHFGKLSGEYRALEMIRSIAPATVIITGLMPVAGTPMEHIKPDPSDFENIIKKAIEMFHRLRSYWDAPIQAGKTGQILKGWRFYAAFQVSRRRLSQ